MVRVLPESIIVEEFPNYHVTNQKYHRLLHNDSNNDDQINNTIMPYKTYYDHPDERKNTY